MSYDCQAIQYNEFTTEMLNEVNTKSNNFTDITTEKDSLCLDIKTQFKCFCDPYTCICCSGEVINPRWRRSLAQQDQ